MLECLLSLASTTNLQQFAFSTHGEPMCIYSDPAYPLRVQPLFTFSLSQVAKMYVVGALLRNALTCMYKNTTSVYFELEPPDLNEYFA